MALNLLTINVGNTRTQLGAFVDGKLIEQHRVANDHLDQLGGVLRELWKTVGGEAEPMVYLASVNEPVAERVSGIVTDSIGQKVVRLERDIDIPIGRKLDREAIVGEDRLLNAAAAFDRFKQACIVIDAGTAVTVDFIDGEGTFHGGAILPGAQMMLTALHDRTAQLPHITFAAPDEPIGHNTEQAMRTGVFHGIRGAVRELAEKYAEVYGAYPKIIATGGDAPLLFERYDLVEAIVPELTLQGMVVARRHGIETE